jgi:hypothetical protein
MNDTMWLFPFCVAIIESHRLGIYKERQFISHRFGSWEVEGQDAAFGKGLFPVSYVAGEMVREEKGGMKLLL